MGVGVGTVSEVVTRAAVAGLASWTSVQELDDGALEARLWMAGSAAQRPFPDCSWIHTELRRPGVTLQLLHLEYLEKHPDGYRYSQFCEHYRRCVKRQRRSMPQVHRAGEKLFVDYSGQKPHIVDPQTGELIEVELFVAVPGASNYTYANYTYAKATRSQQGPDWIASHVRALEFIGGVPEAVVPDQLKSGVTIPCRYEPGVQRSYEEMAAHYGTVILLARATSSSRTSPTCARSPSTSVSGSSSTPSTWCGRTARHSRCFHVQRSACRQLDLAMDLPTAR
jgi:transposase